MDINSMKVYFLTFIIFAMALSDLKAQSPLDQSAVIGKWNLTFQTDEGSSPGWLEIKQSGRIALTGQYVGSLGSARPISHIKFSEADQQFSFTIPPQWESGDDDLNFRFRLEGEKLTGTTLRGSEVINWEGKRAPSLVRKDSPMWAEPVSLLDQNLTKWNLPENNNFTMANGILVNSEAGGNLISKESFEDFKLHVEFRYPEGSNSGIYLRGRYEIQIADQYGMEPDERTIGGVYGFIPPSENAAKQAGEWQIMDIKLVGRMITVTLNGVEVISNRPIKGITGGALDSNEEQPGPIMLQGDHGPVEFRKVVITPAQ